MTWLPRLLRLFSDLGEQPAAKKSHKQQPKQLTETEILLELVSLQKNELEAGEVAGSTSAGLQPSTGSKGQTSCQLPDWWLRSSSK